MLLPRMLMHRPPGGGVIPQSKLVARFEAFTRGEWIQLLTASVSCNEKAASARQRQRRRGGDDVERRVRRAEKLVHVGERSSAITGAGRRCIGAQHVSHIGPTSRCSSPTTPASRSSPTRDHGFPACNSLRVGRENVLSEPPFCTLRGRWWPIWHDVRTSSSTP